MPRRLASCTVQGCTRPRLYALYCNSHYRRWKRTGNARPDDPIAPAYRNIPLAERFWPRVEKGAGCWLWLGTRMYDPRDHKTPTYGLIVSEGRDIPATHVAWWIANGKWPPKGTMVLHHCDNPPCVKTDPDERWPEGHLFLGTQTDNMQDAKAKGRCRGGGRCR